MCVFSVGDQGLIKVLTILKKKKDLFTQVSIVFLYKSQFYEF